MHFQRSCLAMGTFYQQVPKLKPTGSVTETSIFLSVKIGHWFAAIT